VLVFNRLDAQKILHESKESYDGLGTTVRKNMQTEARRTLQSGRRNSIEAKR